MGKAGGMKNAILIMCVIIGFGSIGSVAFGGADATGDVQPVDPNSWTSSTDVRIGVNGIGGLTVDDGSDVVVRHGYMGDRTNSEGSVTISGSGSTLTSSGLLHVGANGDGVIDITGSGQVVTAGAWIAEHTGSSGKITVSGDESTFNSSGPLVVGPSGHADMDLTSRRRLDSRERRVQRQDDNQRQWLDLDQFLRIPHRL